MTLFIIIILLFLIFTYVWLFRGKNWYYLNIQLGYFLVSGVSKNAYYIAQRVAEFESGHFTSNLTSANNNMFGMKFPKVRKTMATSEVGGFAYFPCLLYSAMDFFMWLKENGVTTTMSYEDIWKKMLERNYVVGDEATLTSYTNYMLAPGHAVNKSNLYKWLLAIVLPTVIFMILVYFASTSKNKFVQWFKLNLSKNGGSTTWKQR